MLRLIHTLAEIGSNVLRGLQEITPNLFETSDTQPPEMTFPRDRFVDELNAEELVQLVQIFQRGKHLYPDMTLDEECFFVADWIIPERYQANTAGSTRLSTTSTEQWRDFDGGFTAAANINADDFKRWIKFLSNHGVISDKIHDELQNKAPHYCQKVARERQYRAFYLDYTAVITAVNKRTADRNILQHYFRIPEQHRCAIENELVQEQEISTAKVLLSTVFAPMLLSAGFIEPNIFRPNPTEKTLDPNLINLPATQATALSMLQFVPQMLGNCIAQLDKALIPLMMLPVARAAKTDPAHHNALYTIVPEFLEGTTKYPKSEEHQLHALTKKMHKKLHPFLRQQTAKSKVIVLGEIHGESFYTKLMLLNYLKQWQFSHQYHPFKFNFIHEMNSSPTVRELVSGYKDVFRKLSPRLHDRSLIDDLLQRNCFSFHEHATSLETMTSVIGYCSLPMAIAYSHHFQIADTAEAQFSDKQKQHMQRYVTNPNSGDMSFFSEPHGTYVVTDALSYSPFYIPVLDTPIIATLTKSLSKNSAEITVIVTGHAHAKAVVRALQELNHPYITFVTKTSNSAKAYMNSRVTVYHENCFKKLRQCPAKTYGLPVKNNYKFCLVEQPYDANKCDTAIHEATGLYLDRFQFSEDPKNAEQLPSTLPSKFPKKLTDLFAPKKSIKFLRKAFAHDPAAEKESEFPKLEL